MAYTPLVTYTMIGYQTSAGSTPGQAVVWNVTGTPDLTGAKSPFPNAIYNISINATTVSPPPNTNVQTPTGPAGGDLNGYYPNPTVQGLQGVPITTSAPVDSAVLTYNADEQELLWVVPESGDVTFAGDLSGNDSTQTVVGIQNTPVVAGTVVDGYVLTVNSDGYYEPLPASGGGGIPEPADPQNGDILFYQGGEWNLRHIGSSGEVLTVFEGSPAWEPSESGIEIFSGGVPVESTTTLGVDGTTIAVNNVSGIPTLSAISSGSNATELQSVPVSATTPTDGYVLGYNGSEWLAVPQSSGGGGANIPALTFNAPPDASSFTVVGNGAIADVGTFVIARISAQSQQSNAFLVPFPGGVNTAGPYAVTATGVAHFDYSEEYPGFGVVVSNGITAGTSKELWSGAYRQSWLWVIGAWTYVIATDSRPSVFTDNQDGMQTNQGQLYYRIINDGVSFLCQYSMCGGYSWRTSTYNSISTVNIGTPTYYGIDLGQALGSATGTAVISSLQCVTIPQVNISNAVGTGTIATITTSTAHNLATGCSLTIQGLTTSAGNLNTLYEGIITVTGTTTFTLANSSTFTYVSGGIVTRTDL